MVCGRKHLQSWHLWLLLVTEKQGIAVSLGDIRAVFCPARLLLTDLYSLLPAICYRAFHSDLC